MGVVSNFWVSARTSPMFFVTAVLLLISNVFMTFAWYGHLKYASSAEFVGEFWLGKLAKCVI